MQIKIGLANCYSQILTRLNQEQIALIDDVCSFWVKNAIHSKLYKRHLWDGKKHLFNMGSFTFPTGLYSKVVSILKENNTIKVIDQRKKPNYRIESVWNEEVSLRGYQKEVVKQAVQIGRGLLTVSTSGGKNRIYARIAYELGVKTVLFVNTKEALWDSYEEFSKCLCNEEIGIYGDGNKKVGKFITIATMAGAYKSLINNDLKLLEIDPGLIIIDESHRSAADTWFKTAQLFNAYYRLGGSGTNFRNDGADIMLLAATGKQICEVKTKELEKLGYVTPCHYYFININGPEYLNQPFANFHELYDLGIVENEYRNEWALKLVEKYKEKSKLVLVDKIKHGELLLERIRKVDQNAVLLTGKTKDRKYWKTAFVDGLINTVVATKIFDESVNVPRLEVVIVLSSGKSGIKVIQRIGRSIRLFADKKVALIFDFMDLFNYKLTEHSRQRYRFVKKEKHTLYVIDNINEITD